MAKDSQLSPFERHVEKVVLAVCVLLLVYVLVYFARSSPRLTEVKVITTAGTSRKKMVAPEGLDQAVAEAVHNAYDVIVNSDVTAPPPIVVNDSMRLRDQPFPDSFAIVPLSSGQMTEGTGIAPQPELIRPTLAEVAEALPAPSKPDVWAGPELPNRENLRDVVVAHIVSVYQIKLLDKKLEEVLAGSAVPEQFVALRVEAEVEELLPDRTWTNRRAVNAVSLPILDRDGKEIQTPALPGYDGTNKEDIDEIIKQLSQDWQERILQPEYWDIWWPGYGWIGWRVHLPRTSVSEWFEQPEEGTTRRPSPPTVRPKRTTPAPRVPAKPKRPVRRTLPPDLPLEMIPPDELMREYEMPDELRRRRRPAPAPTTPRRRPRPKPKLRIPTPVGEEELPPPPDETPVPALAEQLQRGEVLIWMHDTSLESTKVYRYRLRLVLANPLLTYARDVKEGHEADARKPSVTTPWSEWSQQVSVPRATEFFVTGSSSTLRRISVTVFAHSLGQRVKRTFPVSVGQAIGGEVKVGVIDPSTGERLEQDVDFSTGAIVVALDFKKRITGGGGIARQTVELLLLDENGRLKSQTGALDRSSERYKELLKEARRAEAAAREQE